MKTQGLIPLLRNQTKHLSNYHLSTLPKYIHIYLYRTLLHMQSYSRTIKNADYYSKNTKDTNIKFNFIEHDNLSPTQNTPLILSSPLNFGQEAFKQHNYRQSMKTSSQITEYLGYTLNNPSALNNGLSACFLFWKRIRHNHKRTYMYNTR